MKNTNITWIDPVTGEQICSLNQCRKKFKEKVVEKATLRVVNGKQVMYDVFYSKCSECGRNHAFSSDKQKTQDSKNESEKSLIFLKELG